MDIPSMMKRVALICFDSFLLKIGSRDMMKRAALITLAVTMKMFLRSRMVMELAYMRLDCRHRCIG